MNSARVTADVGPWRPTRGEFTELSREYYLTNLGGPGTETKIDLRCRLEVEEDRAVRPLIYLVVEPYFLKKTGYVCAIFAPSDDLLNYEVLTAKVEATSTRVNFIVFDIADGEKLLRILMLGRQITLRLIGPRDSIAFFPLENDVTFRDEFEALKLSLQVESEMTRMRVDFGEWYTDRPGLVARKYTYSQMVGTRDTELEVHFDIQAGLSVFTFVSFLISNLDLPHEVPVRVTLRPMDGGSPEAVMTMTGTPKGGGAVLGLAGPDDVRQCLKVFFEGKGMHFEVDSADGEKLIRLPLPNDHAFRTAYRASYERVRAADEANFPDGVMGRLNRFMRDLPGRLRDLSGR